jgi:2-hydroxy-6-oxonona-2,4-dienedioate hydrolase
MAKRTWRRLLPVAFAVVATVVAAFYLPARQAALARVSGGARLVQTPCGPIEYATTGPAPTVLVVHGAGGGFDQGLAFARDLALPGTGAIAMSRFGCLGTPLPADASAEAQADAHACLLDALGIDRVAIVGISAGAPSALQFALRHPRRTSALVLLVPATYVPRAGDAPPVKVPAGTRFFLDTALRSDLLMWIAIHLAHDDMVRAILATPPAVFRAASPQEQARARGLLASILPVSRRRLGLLNDGRVTTTLPRYDLRAIAAPTLAVSVADDLFGTYDSARYTAKEIPGARFVGYERGGHVWLGHHAEVVDEVSRFVATHR